MLSPLDRIPRAAAKHHRKDDTRNGMSPWNARRWLSSAVAWYSSTLRKVGCLGEQFNRSPRAEPLELIRTIRVEGSKP